MANRLGILTALVLAVAAFVAFKNKKQYENVIATTQTEKQSLTTSNARLTADRVVLDALPIERTGVDEEVNQLVTD